MTSSVGRASQGKKKKKKGVSPQLSSTPLSMPARPEHETFFDRTSTCHVLYHMRTRDVITSHHIPTTAKESFNTPRFSQMPRTAVDDDQCSDVDEFQSVSEASRPCMHMMCG